MNKKPFAYFLCAVTLLLIAISPFLITSFFSEPSATTTYEGIIEMWHISDWRTGGSSMNAYLLRRISEFEDKNPHVFIRTSRLTTTQAVKALHDGDIPDIISYPSTFEVDLDNQRPYMYGAYYIIINTDIANEHGIELPDSFGIRPDTLLDIAKFGLVYDAEENYSALPAIALHEYPDVPSPNITTWDNEQVPDAALNLAPSEYFGGLSVFLKEDAAVLIASHRQLFEVQSKYEQNEGPAFVSYAISGYTDMVQYMSVYPNDDMLKLLMCQSFADYIISDSAQKKLYALGVFPATDGIEIYQDNECNAAVYKFLHEKPAVVSPSLQESLTDLTLRSFAGDSNSLRQLRRLLTS